MIKQYHFTPDKKPLIIVVLLLLLPLRSPFLESWDVKVASEEYQALKVQVAQCRSFRLQDIPCRAEQSLHGSRGGQSDVVHPEEIQPGIIYFFNSENLSIWESY